MKNICFKFKDLLGIALLVILFVSCEKKNNDTEEVSVKDEFTVSTGIDIGINGQSAQVPGKIRLTSGSVGEYGHCWSKFPDPTYESDLKSNLGTSNESIEFISQIDQLTKGTSYFVRAYAKSKDVIVYGNESAFMTSSINVSEVIVGDKTTTSVSLSVTLDIGEFEPLKYGFCWATHDMPSMNDSFVELDNLNENSFSTVITGLTSGEVYYFRGYSVLEQNVMGPVLEVSLKDVELAMQGIEQNINTGVIVNANFDFTTPLTEHGFCWSKEADPSLNDESVSLGELSQSGEVNHEIENLTHGDSYYFVAYARTSNDSLFYSEVISITLDKIVVPDYPGEGNENPEYFNLNGDIYVGLCVRNNDLWKLDENGWEQKQSYPLSLESVGWYNESGYYTSNEKGYVFHRINEYHDNGIIVSYKYQEDSNEWVELPSLVLDHTVERLSSVVVNDRVFLFATTCTIAEYNVYELIGNSIWEQRIEDGGINGLRNIAFTIGTKVYSAMCEVWGSQRYLESYDLETNQLQRESVLPFSIEHESQLFELSFFTYNNEYFCSKGEKVYKYDYLNKTWIRMKDFNGDSKKSVSFEFRNKIFIGMGEHLDKSFIEYIPEER